MSARFLDELNFFEDNVNLVSFVVLDKIIKTWLENIFDPFFSNNVNNCWNYIYKKDIDCHSQHNNYNIVEKRFICNFLDVTDLDSVCCEYNSLSDKEKKSVTPIQLGLNPKPIQPSMYMDLQSMVKILKHRVFIDYDKHDGSRIHDWAEKIISIRNDISIAHSKGLTKLYWTDDKCKTDIIDKLIELTKKAKLAADDEWPHYGGGLNKAFSKLEEELVRFKEDYIKVVYGTPLKMDESALYYTDDLFGYKILFAFVDTENDYTRSFIQDLSKWYGIYRRNKCFYMDSNTVDKLVTLSKTDSNAKILLKDLNPHAEYSCLKTIETETADLNKYRTDTVLENLKSVQGKWCVITGDEYLASDIQDLNNPDIVVMKVMSRTSIAPFTQTVKSVNFTLSFEGDFEKENTATPKEEPILYESEPEEPVIEESVKPAVELSGFQKTKPQKAKVSKRNIPKGGGLVFHESDNNPQFLYTEVSKGGEGTIYNTGMGNTYVKLYHDHTWNINRANKISAMRSFSPNLPETICWPLEAIFHPDRDEKPIGYEMLNVKFKSPDAIPLDELIYELSYENPWNWNRTNLVKLCQNIARSFGDLHRNNIIMGDVNPKNILVDKKGKVWFIDTDSYQFEYNGIVYRCEVGTPEFSSPRLHKMKCKFREIDRTFSDEYFAIACLFFQILFLGESPYPTEAKNVRYSIVKNRFRLHSVGAQKHNYKWGNLTLKIKKAFEDVFVREIYIDEKQWLELLIEMEDSISKHQLSNMLDPTSAPQLGVPFKIDTLHCEQCGNSFEFFNDKEVTTSEDEFCPSCKKSRNLQRTKIIKVKCSKCGEIFTVNKWDMVRRKAHLTGQNGKEIVLSEFDTDTALCPDCDSRVCVPNEAKLLSNNSEIEKAMENAKRNSNIKWELLMYGETES